MTKKFDDNAREEYIQLNDFTNLEYNNVKVKDMIIKEITVKQARKYIATYHYSKSMPDSTKYVYAGFYKDKLAGIIVYGMGAGKSQYKAIIPNIENGEYLELTRLWSADSMPKNTESKLISESIKLLPKEIRLILSFADEEQGHFGYIYQATNFYYCGKTTTGKRLLLSDGTTQHSRLLGIYKMRHPELKDKTNKEIMDIYGWKYIANSSKFRYVMLRGNKKIKKEMFKFIKNKIESYPKKN